MWPERDLARLEHTHTLLVGAVERLVASDGWHSMLEVAARFHRYSARNVLLLVVQGAEGFVAGYRTWQRIPAQGGGTCQVRRGAKGFVVLAPTRRPVTAVDEHTGEETRQWVLAGFRTTTVFDDRALVAPPAIPTVAPTLLD
ncbi:MAG: ArdC family protein, partial [Acidimicrobiales bacterium]